MKKASVVSIGNELLNGHCVDTNTGYLAGRLIAIGVPVVSSNTVGDDIDLIGKTLQRACAEADFVLVTGGLGPTDDDITRQACAKFMGGELELRHELLEKIEGYFLNKSLQMPEMNKIQAYIPAGAESLENNLGTAPGILVRRGDKLLAFMPGVPSEMKAMFEDSVMPAIIAAVKGQAIVLRKLHCFGAGESVICSKLGSLMQRDRNPLVNCTVKYGIVTLHIVSMAANAAQAGKMADETEKTLRGIIGDLIFGVGDQTLAGAVGQKLAEQGKTVAVAESCTGGFIAEMLTEIPGASTYFTQGWVTYSNQSKASQLSVPPDLIEKHGAVSKEVAEAMAINVRRIAKTDFAVAVTGIAGPGGGSAEKPVGLVYIAVDGEDGCQSGRFIFGGDRNTVRIRAAQTALNMLRLKLGV